MLQVTVDGDEAVGMGDEEGFTQAILSNGQMTDIPIGSGVDRQPFPAACTNIYSHMKVSFPQLAKVGSQLKGPVQGRAKIST
jgi:hypothetical protein